MSALDTGAALAPAEIAERLLTAADTASEIPSFGAVLDVATAYEAQRLQHAARLARGERTVGAKLGLTSAAKQQSMGVHEPVRGFLTDAMVHPGGDQELALDGLIHPRAEPELVLLTNRELRGPGCTAAEVLAATEAVALGLEILDSRYEAFRFTLPDVVADNTSAARFVLGTQLAAPTMPLDLIGMVLRINGRLAATAAGAALLGHPAASVAWAVNHLAAAGEGIPAGSIVLAGAPTDAFALNPGDVVEVEAHGLGTARLRVADDTNED